MGESGPSQFKSFAIELANIVVEVVAAQRDGLEVEVKGDGSPVTGVDFAVETALRRHIEAAFPEHGILGEELPARHPDAEWCWVLDPIDGTSHFAAGLPLYGSLLALCRDGEPQLGVICQPDTGDVFLGIKGQGAWLNDQPIATSGAVTLGEAALCISDPDAFAVDARAVLAQLRQAASWHVYEGGCLGFAAVATGRIGVSIYGDNVENFDICALAPVVEGAGGVMTDWQGNTINLASSGSVVASASPALHAEVLAMLNESGES